MTVNGFRLPDSFVKLCQEIREGKTEETWLLTGSADIDSHGNCLSNTDVEFLTSADAQIRESCMVLAEAYLDFVKPSPDTAWLDLPDWIINRNRGLIRHQLDGGAGYGTCERIAEAVADVQRLYRGAPPDESAKEEAIAAGHLVIVEASREAYWEGERIDADWNQLRAPWDLLQQLARRGRVGQAVCHDDLFDGESLANRSTMANRWRRLKRLLRPSLSRHVRPGPQPMSYLLVLDRHQIHLY